VKRQVAFYWPIITTLAGALLGFGVASYTAGRQLAVLDQLPAALQQVQAHTVDIAVIKASCCPKNVSGPAVGPVLAPRTASVSPVDRAVLSLIGVAL